MLFSIAATLAAAGFAAAAPFVDTVGARGMRSARRSATTVERAPQITNANATGAPWFFYYADKDPSNSGPPTPSEIQGWNVLGLSFWLLEGPWDMVYTWTTYTAAQRQSLKAQYAAAGIKLVVAAFGSSDVPTSTNADPTATAQKLAAFAIEYDFDGVDVDYEDFNAMDAGTAVPWLVTFTKALRAALPSGALLSHAPVAPWFTTDTATYPGGDYLDVYEQAGSAITFFNVQFYNQGSTAYADCTSLITTSNLANYPNTALLQIVASGVPASKLLIGKPGNTGDQTSGGYMSPSTLATCVSQAKAKGWNGGLMVWEYPDAINGYVAEVWGS